MTSHAIEGMRSGYSKKGRYHSHPQSLFLLVIWLVKQRFITGSSVDENG